MGIEIKKEDIRKLLEDEALLADVTKSALEDPKVIKDIAEDIADDISDQLENDSEFKKKLLQSAIKRETFKAKLLSELVKKLG